jgi:hypothetical protein
LRLYTCPVNFILRLVQTRQWYLRSIQVCNAHTLQSCQRLFTTGLVPPKWNLPSGICSKSPVSPSITSLHCDAYLTKIPMLSAQVYPSLEMKRGDRTIKRNTDFPNCLYLSFHPGRSRRGKSRTWHGWKNKPPHSSTETSE